jgi:hypothetical protein
MTRGFVLVRVNLWIVFKSVAKSIHELHEKTRKELWCIQRGTFLLARIMAGLKGS